MITETASASASPRTIFVADGEGRRGWSRLIPGVVLLAWEPATETLPGEWSQTPQPGSVVICHQLGDDERHAVSALAKSGVHVLFVSLSHGRGKIQDGSYERIRPVLKDQDDLGFARCLRRFMRELDRSAEPPWEMLEGVSPNALLAYHLLGLMPDDPEAMRERERLRDDAAEEGEALAALAGSSASTPWSDDLLDAPPRLRDFLMKYA